MQLSDLSREAMIKVVTEGREGSAMMSFAAVLNRAEIEAVVDYVRDVFIAGDGINTRYHIPANGWEDHQRYAPAFPFATGEIALDTPLEQLTPLQQEGRQLFISACVTCHDRSKVEEEGEWWSPRAVSFPRGGYSNKASSTVALTFERDLDALSSATPFARHEIAPEVAGLTPQQRLGEQIFQANCAFCHGATATGRNWVGSFLQPPPRDLTDAEAMAGMTHQRLTQVITEGLVDTTMPAWRGVLSREEIDAVAAYVMRVFVPRSDRTQ
ncbi:MAG TPA: c-type cytochrome [Chromatiales bacterium]|nr:c-type cytochrome [Chromatiales bacterium]